MIALLLGLAATAEQREVDPAVARRTVEIVLTGLRVEVQNELPTALASKVRRSRGAG